MNKELRIAIVGTSRAGKDTFASILEKVMQEEGCSESVKIAFADPIKDLYSIFFNYLETKEKPRDAYVTIGNSFRSIDSTVWIRQLLRKASENAEKGLSSIVTDCRYENEAEVLRENGFTIIKIDADDWIRVGRAEALGEKLDLMNEGDLEVRMIEADYSIINNGEDDFKSMPSIARHIVQEVLNGVYY